MRILVTFGLEQEFTPWRRLRGFERAAVTLPSVFDARIAGCDVRVVLTGIGEYHARRAFHVAVADGAQLCVSTGLAGGLRPRYRLGDVLVARSVLDAAGVLFVKSNGALVQTAGGMGAKVVDAFRSLDHVVTSATEKSHLAFSADAVEMESFAILNEAQSLHIPAVALRVVGDTSDEDLPLDFGRVVGPRGEVSLRRVIAQVARRPLAVPALARLGRQTQRSAARLALFLDQYVQALATGGEVPSKLVEAAAG